MKISKENLCRKMISTSKNEDEGKTEGAKNVTFKENILFSRYNICVVCKI